MQEKRKALEQIFRAAVERVDPERLIKKSMTLKGDILSVDTDESHIEQDLSQFDKIVAIGCGKATAKMARAAESILQDRIDAGVICVKYGHSVPLTCIRTIEAGHPVPDQNGLTASRLITDIARQADEKTLVITLISGGGSALIPYPFRGEVDGESVGISLAEKQTVTRTLLECGAVINEINCLRKHLSLIKGGGLAKMIYPAASLNLILSDVVDDSLDAIASGPTTWDKSTFADVARIIAKYDIETRLPASARRLFTLGCQGKIPDTPEQDDQVFARVHNLLIGTNYMSLQAAAEKARALGFHPLVLSSQIIGEAREVARVYCGIGKDAKRKNLLGRKPLCLIAGGETTVTLTGSGKGGRNQEMALAFLSEIEQHPEATRGIYFLSASTDGNDGPTDAAGAFACNEILEEATAKGLRAIEFLKNNDAYSFFDAVGYLLKTGPTNTNVCDIQLMLI